MIFKRKIEKSNPVPKDSGKKMDAIIRILEQTTLIDWNYKNKELVEFAKEVKSILNESTFNPN